MTANYHTHTKRCNHAGGTEKVSDENTDVGWFTPEEAGKMITNPHFRKALEEMLAYDGRVFFGAFKNNEDGTMKQVCGDRIG